MDQGRLKQVACPACGHTADVHPRTEAGEYSCTRSLTELPSCQECRALLESLRVLRVSGIYTPDRQERLEEMAAAWAEGIPPGQLRQDSKKGGP